MATIIFRVEEHQNFYTVPQLEALNEQLEAVAKSYSSKLILSVDVMGDGKILFGGCSQDASFSDFLGDVEFVIRHFLQNPSAAVPTQH